VPIYEYVCRECGNELERLQKLSDAPLTDCPECGQSALKRKVSAAGFRLAGGGWYETDFKSDGRRNIAGDHQTAASGTSGDKSSEAAAGSGSANNEGGKKTTQKTDKKADGQKATSQGASSA